MIKKLFEILNKLNQEGFPVPMLKDPKTGKGSLTATMYWITFNVSILTLAGRITKIIGEVDYNNLLWLLGITGGMYLGRKMQASKDGISVDGKEE